LNPGFLSGHVTLVLFLASGQEFPVFVIEIQHFDWLTEKRGGAKGNFIHKFAARIVLTNR